MNKNIIALILIVLSAGIYFTVTSGIITDAQTVKAVNDQYAVALDNAAKLVSMRDEVRKQYDSISAADRERLDKMIPSTVDNIRLIVDLNGLAAIHGLSLTDIKASVSSSGSGQGQAVGPGMPGAANPAGTPGSTGPSAGGQSPQAFSGAPSGMQVANAPSLDTVQVSFGVSATYDQFMSFLEDLEADLRIMDLTKLSVKASDKGVYDYTLEFNTYWLKQ